MISRHHPLFPIPVKVVPAEHSAWDVALFVLAAIAAVGAVVAIWAWVVQLRKTPEVRFDWAIDGVKGWEPGQHEVLKRGTPLPVRVIVTNVGTGSADGAVVNIVVPSFVDIQGLEDRSSGKPLTNHIGTDNVVDNPPDHEVNWVVTRLSEFYPSLPVVMSFSLSIGASWGDVYFTRTYFIAVSIEAVGLPASGRRFVPSWAHRVPGERSRLLSWLTSYGWWPSWLHWGTDDFWGQTDWPGRRYRRSLRRVRALPRGHVRSGPGRRQDRRPFEVDLSGND